MYKGEIPFDDKGNQLHYPSGEVVWVTNDKFKAMLTFTGFRRGRSAAYAVFEDQKGRTYNMFLTDLGDMLRENVLLNGDWEYCKRGQNYGVKKA